MFAGGSHPSFEMAAKALERLAEVKVSDRQLGRITEEIGTEMTRQRDLKTARHQEKTLPVAVAGIPSLVVVEIDGGRYLARDPAAGTGPGAHGVGWKEDKAACLVTMTSAAFDHDPHPTPLGTFEWGESRTAIEIAGFSRVSRPLPPCAAGEAVRQLRDASLAACSTPAALCGR